TSTACVGSQASRDGGLRKSGSHGGRRRYWRTFRQDHGIPESAWPLFHWRSGRRHWPARRLQLPVGLGVGILRWAGGVRSFSEVAATAGSCRASLGLDGRGRPSPHERVLLNL